MGTHAGRDVTELTHKEKTARAIDHVADLLRAGDLERASTELPFTFTVEAAYGIRNAAYRLVYDPWHPESIATQGFLDRELKPGRYSVVFTPVGWQVIDTVEARDPVAEFGTGSDEYGRARVEAARLNESGQGAPKDDEPERSGVGRP
jgi:hypothetical protein